MRYLVTGASGLIGAEVAQRLVQEGHEVRVLLRNKGSGSRISGLEATPFYGDITKLEGLPDGAFSGVDAVFHFAALAGPGHAYDDVMRTNFHGTRHVTLRAIAHGVPHIVYASSVAVYGSSAGIFTEHSALDRSSRNSYVKTKIGAEDYLRELQDHIRSTSLRYTYTVSPDCTFFKLLIGQLESGRYPLFDRGDACLSLLSTYDAATAALLAARRKGAQHEVYNVATDQFVSWARLYELLQQATGIRARPLYVNAGVMRACAWLLDRFKDAPLDLFQAGLLTNTAAYSTTKIRDELGFVAQHDYYEELPWHTIRR